MGGVLGAAVGVGWGEGRAGLLLRRGGREPVLPEGQGQQGGTQAGQSGADSEYLHQGDFGEGTKKPCSPIFKNS